MNATVTIPAKEWTESELQALPENGYNTEVVSGELVMSPKNDFFHGNICIRISTALQIFNREHRLGVILDSSTGFWMQNRNCRAPDVSFVSKARLAQAGFKPSARRFFTGAPDLAIEILSPNNSRTEIEARLKDFFSSGAKLVWIIDPTAEMVEICHSLQNRKLIGHGGQIDGEALLPGFAYPIADLFKEWDWD